jgi:fatty acid desaturase
MSAPAATRLEDLSRRALSGDDGTTYLAFRSTLTPRWGRLWLAFGLGYVALVALMVGVVAVGGIVGAVVGGLLLGFVIHYLVLFQHEAAHFNLAPTRAGNDRLCDVAIGLIVGESIASYRVTHLNHHRHLGTTKDTERSYFDSLDARWLAECLTGIRPVRVMLTRSRMAGADASPGGGEGRSSFLSPTLIGAALVNGAIVVGSFLLGWWPLSVAWILGVIVFWPLCNTGRQILEHRSFDASRAVDYTVTDHGATNRLFGSGPLASTLGGAGFNRHLLHHWDPGVSCTRLADLEGFLDGTMARPVLDDARGTYLGTMRKLWGR